MQGGAAVLGRVSHVPGVGGNLGQGGHWMRVAAAVWHATNSLVSQLSEQLLHKLTKQRPLRNKYGRTVESDAALKTAESTIVVSFQLFSYSPRIHSFLRHISVGQLSLT